MGRRHFAILTLSALLLTGLLPAAGAKKPKQQKTAGEVVAVAGERLELKTKKGVVVVLLTENPRIGMGDAELSITALKKGTKVTVVGPTQPSGEILAHQILLPAPAAPPQMPSGSGHAGHVH